MVWEIFFGVKTQSAVSRKDRKSCIEQTHLDGPDSARQMD